MQPGTYRSFAVCLLTLAIVLPLLAAPTPVKVWEEKVTIPTYLIGPPDPNPQFYFGGASQGAQHRIYPYPAYDNLTTEKKDKTYNMVFLENEYVKIGILPELGGKVFEAVDKTNGYDFIYHQHVIKPALISLLGAWISGGIEWDIPHHHRATSFLPVQYKIEENADGSKTVWVGELELRDRMGWAVGLTLHPGKSYHPGFLPHDEPDPGPDLDAELLQRCGSRQRQLPDHLSSQHAVRHLSRQARFHYLANCDHEVHRLGLHQRALT